VLIDAQADPRQIAHQPILSPGDFTSGDIAAGKRHRGRMTLQRVLVTGASGFVARHLVGRLRVAFPAAELILCGTGLVELDITDTSAVDKLIRSVQPDICVHLAAVSAVNAARQDPAHAWQVNLHGTLALAQAILTHAPECVLMFISSAEIYGWSFRTSQPLDETAAAAPMNIYASTKAAADLTLGALAGDGLRAIRLRPFNHTGPGQADDFVVPAFARQVARIAAGKQPPLLRVGALDPQRDFLDVRDVCDAYVACIQRADSLPPGTIFNIASGVPRKIGDILQQLLDIAGVTAEIETNMRLLRPSEIPMAVGDAGRARAELKWAPAIAWDQTLAEVFEDWVKRVRDEA
jgi:GDP-4-dehydro-6-deoxy-D-mannose reductase